MTMPGPYAVVVFIICMVVITLALIHMAWGVL